MLVAGNRPAKKYNIIIKSRGSSYSFPVNLHFCISATFAIKLRYGKFEVYRSVTESGFDYKN